MLGRLLARKEPVAAFIQGTAYVILGPEPSDVYTVTNDELFLFFRNWELAGMLLLIDMDGTQASSDFLMRPKHCFQIIFSSSSALPMVEVFARRHIIDQLVLNPPPLTTIVDM